jgi:hypothetical protein
VGKKVLKKIQPCWISNRSENNDASCGLYRNISGPSADFTCSSSGEKVEIVSAHQRKWDAK